MKTPIFALHLLITLALIKLSGQREYINDSKCEKFGSNLLARFLTKKPFPPEYDKAYKLLQYSATAIGDLGDYKGCKSLNYSRYFILTATITIYKQSIGFCYYKDCDPQDLKKALDKVMSLASNVLDLSLNKDKLIVRDPDEELVKYRTESLVGLIIVMGIISLIILISVIQLFIDSSFLSYFNIKDNLKEYFIDKDEGKPEAEILKKFKMINGAKALASAWVIFGEMFYIPIYYVKNTASMYYLTKKWFFNFVSGAFFATDTFFFFSGFLFCFSVQKYLSKQRRTKIIAKFLWRYLRFLPLMLFMIFGITYIMPFLSSGPNYYMIQTLNRGCRSNWWHNLLFINNLVKYDENSLDNSVCVLQMWYLACNMQFYFYGVVVYFLFFDRKLLKFLTLGLTYTGSIGIQFYTAYHYQFRYNNVQKPSVNDAMFTAYYYILPWNRINPFIIGIFFCEMLIESKLYQAYWTKEKENENENVNEKEKKEEKKGQKEAKVHKIIKEEKANLKERKKEKNNPNTGMKEISDEDDHDSEGKNKSVPSASNVLFLSEKEDRNFQEHSKYSSLNSNTNSNTNSNSNTNTNEPDMPTCISSFNNSFEDREVYFSLVVGFVLINATFWTSYIGNVTDLSQFMDAFMLAFAKDFFVVGLGIILHATYLKKTGYSLIYSLLTLRWLKIYNKATYGIMYLHIVFFFLFFYQYPSIYYMAVGDFVIFSFAVLIISFITSLLLGSLIEKPINNLILNVLKKRENISIVDLLSSFSTESQKSSLNPRGRHYSTYNKHKKSC